MLFKLTVHTRKGFQLLMAVIYCAFFTVQLFFNFDITWLNHSSKDLSVISTVKYSGSSTVNSVSKKQEEQNNSKPRLNKRFQPRSFDFLPVLFIDPFIAFIAKDQKFISFQSLQLATFVQHYSLRGPPVISLSI